MERHGFTTLKIKSAGLRPLWDVRVMEALREAFFAGGLPPVGRPVDDVYRATYATMLGERGVIRDRPPAMGGEDFSFMLLERPGCFVKVGQRGRDGRGGTPLHNPSYDFNDEMLPLGAGYFAALVEQELPRG